MTRSALVIAHPGHELRVHGWLGQARPIVFVLTDGSGSAGVPRIESTRRILAEQGARPGPIFGRHRDGRLYDALIARDFDFFAGMLRTLADTLERERIDTIVGDEAEGYNPVHDIARYLVDAAASLQPRPIRNLEFPVVGESGSRETALRLVLDEAAAQRKLAAARSYPEMSAEIEAAISWSGDVNVFREERLHAAPRRVPSTPEWAAKPFYETYGEQQVELGVYSRVIRYAEHVLPLRRALAEVVATPAV